MKCSRISPWSSARRAAETARRALLLGVATVACGMPAGGGADAGTAGSDWVGTGGTYAERCQKAAAGICAQWEKCCATTLQTCVTELAKECMNPGKFAGLADAAVAGRLVLDPTLARDCDAEIALIGSTCSSLESSQTFLPCIFAWVDPAALGSPCVDASGEFCANGSGLCALRAGVATCVTPIADGASCSAHTAECRRGSLCLPGAMTCAACGSVCGSCDDVAILCPEGQVCAAQTCTADRGAPAGAHCGSTSDCKRDHTCVNGLCNPLLCAEIARL